jgi:hypothetical protein
MLGDTLTITVNAVAKAMKKINQDSFSAEYLLREATQEFRTKVRHSKEKNLVSGQSMDRHNVEFTQTIYPSVTYPTGYTRQVYTVIRNPVSDIASDVDLFSDGLADWVKANATLLVGWES